jgi:hypothetical protein
VWQVIGIYLLLFAIAIPLVAHLEAKFLRTAFLIGSAVALIGVYLPLRIMRRHQWRLVPLLFDEGEQPTIQAIHFAPE